MSRGEIPLYCEDEDRGPTVRLLFITLETLRGRGVRVAEAVAPRPTGSKEDVKVRVRHARRDRVRGVSVRDRDFLERGLVADFRGKALPTSPARGSAEAWPLSRYSIESYLLDPAFLARFDPRRDEPAWRALVEELAEARQWTDLVRATLVDLRYRIGNAERSKTDGLFPGREAALSRLHELFEETRAAVGACFAGDALQAKFEALEQDFAADGPLFTRVDGKRLLSDLDDRLVREGARRAGGLSGSLLQHAERHGGPEALVADLEPLLSGLAGVPSAAW
jgi:hypothetical protein